MFPGLCLYNQDILLSDLDMKDFKDFKKVLKSKKPSLAIHGPVPATSTSALIISTADPIPSISASGATEEVIHQATGLSVGLQVQEINNRPRVSAPAAGINLVHTTYLSTAID